MISWFGKVWVRQPKLNLTHYGTGLGSPIGSAAAAVELSACAIEG